MQGKHRNKRIFPWVSLKIVTDVLKKQVMWWGDLGQMEWDWGGEGQRVARQRCFSEQSNTLGAERLSAEMRCGESPPERDCYLGSLQSARSVWNAAMELNHWSDADSVAGRTFQMTFNPNENMVSNLERSPKFSNLRDKSWTFKFINLKSVCCVTSTGEPWNWPFKPCYQVYPSLGVAGWWSSKWVGGFPGINRSLAWRPKDQLNDWFLSARLISTASFTFNRALQFCFVSPMIQLVFTAQIALPGVIFLLKIP